MRTLKVIFTKKWLLLRAASGAVIVDKVAPCFVNERMVQLDLVAIGTDVCVCVAMFRCFLHPGLRNAEVVRINEVAKLALVGGACHSVLLLILLLGFVPLKVGAHCSCDIL